MMFWNTSLYYKDIFIKYYNIRDNKYIVMRNGG